MNRNKKVNRFVKGMVDAGLTLALAESVTCGLAAHLLSTCKGTSEMFRGSVVCYNEAVKKELMKVRPATLKKHSAESQEVTDDLAHALSRLITADVHAAITGLASAGGSERPGKPVGTVFFSVLFRRKLHRKRHLFRGTPLQVRTKASLALYEMIEAICLNT